MNWKIYNLVWFFCVMVFLGFSQEAKIRLNIPDEIISRIPEGEVAQFLMARQRVIDKNPMLQNIASAYEEIGVNEEVLLRIPGHDLFLFLNERGYVEIDKHEHIGAQNNGPTPKQMLRIIYTLIAVFTGLILTHMLLGYYLKRKEQEIVVKALDNKQEIPYTLLYSQRRGGLLTYGIFFLALAIGIFILGIFDVMSPKLAIIPMSISIGYFVNRYLNSSEN